MDYIIPPRTSSGREIEVWHKKVCQYLNTLRGVRNTLARVYLASNQAINHDDDTKVSGYTESFDIGNNFASDKYTVPITGYYHISFGILFYDAEGKLASCVGLIYKNGARLFQGSQWQGTDKYFIGSNGADIQYLVAGEYLELWGYITTTDSSAAVMYAGSPYTFLSVHLIST